MNGCAWSMIVISSLEDEGRGPEKVFVAKKINPHTNEFSKVGFGNANKKQSWALLLTCWPAVITCGKSGCTCSRLVAVATCP